MKSLMESLIESPMESLLWRVSWGHRPDPQQNKQTEPESMILILIAQAIGVGWEEEGRYQAVRPSELSYDFLSHSISQLQPSSSSQRDRERHPGRQLNYDDGSTGHQSGPFINCQNCKLKPLDTNPVNLSNHSKFSLVSGSLISGDVKTRQIAIAGITQTLSLSDSS